MKSITLFFGRNRNTTTSIKEYGANYDRIFSKKKSSQCVYCLKEISPNNKDHGGPCCDSCYFFK